MNIMYSTENDQTVFCYTEQGFKELCESDIDREIVLKTPADILIEVPRGVESVRVSGNTHAVINGDSSVFVEDHGYVIAYDKSVVSAIESATVEMHGNSKVVVFNDSDVKIISDNLVVKERVGNYTRYFSFEGGEVLMPPVNI